MRNVSKTIHTFSPNPSSGVREKFPLNGKFFQNHSFSPKLTSHHHHNLMEIFSKASPIIIGAVEFWYLNPSEAKAHKDNDLTGAQ